ncbi:MAG TPA: hypothetical protein VEV37_04995 [Bryobacteraceae bacterium]|nr:hypothetical protein [Bryobacteraceae bacterium]
MTRFLLLCLAFSFAAVAAPPVGVPTQPVREIETGFRQMYNLEFDQAHQTFASWQRQHPTDPIGPASNAAAYLYSEFDRLNILHSELFVDDGLFKHRPKAVADPTVRQAFEEQLAKAEQLADKILSQIPEQTDALFAKILTLGLRADYLSLIERRDLEALRIVKTSRATAEKLLSIDPSYYDAYLAPGVENYLLSIKPAPVRWLLKMNGAETDRERGIQDLQLAAEKGHYLSPYARLLLAVAALRANDRPKAAELLADLAREFPHNRLYAQELARLK